MLKYLAIIIGVISTVTFFYIKTLSLILFIIPVAYLALNLWSMCQIHGTPDPSLSTGAQNLIRRYPYWYKFPTVAKDSGEAARMLSLFGVVLATISADPLYPLCFGAFIISAILMFIVSRKVDPIRNLKNEEDIKSHEEIIALICHR